MRALLWSVVVKNMLSWKAKAFNLLAHFVPTLTYGHEIWVVTEKTTAAEVGFPRRMAGLRLRDRVRSSAICRELRVELLLLGDG